MLHDSGQPIGIQDTELLYRGIHYPTSKLVLSTSDRVMNVPDGISSSGSGKENTIAILHKLEPEILQLGDHGESISTLQHALVSLKYYAGNVNGHFDSETESALKSFQEEYGLDPDGVFGPQTWYAMVFWTQEEELAGLFAPLTCLLKRIMLH